MQTARFDAANSNLIGCQETEPDSASLYLLRGYAVGQQGARYLKLVTTSPGRESNLKKVAESEFEKSEADFLAALERLKRTPDNELSYMLLVNRGLVRFQRGRLDEAAADFLEAIRTRKDPNAHANLAFVYYKQGKADDAIAQISQAIALKPDWAPLYRARAELVQSRPGATPADRQAAQADLKLAILHEDRANQVLARDHTNLGKLLYLEGRFKPALEETKLALQSAPDYIDASVLQFQVLLQLKLYDEVIRTCDIALAKGRKSAVIYEFRGLAESARENYPGAIRDFGLALEFPLHDGSILKDRGWAYLGVDANKLALVDFDAAIKLMPADADAFTGRGSAHARLGDHRAAVADAREAIRVGKSDPRVTYNAARIYAMAASVAVSEVATKGRSAGLLASQYQDTAVELIRERLEREPPDQRPAFWRDKIQRDPAFQSLRRRLSYEALIVANKKQGP